MIVFTVINMTRIIKVVNYMYLPLMYHLQTGFVETDFGKAYEVIHHFVTDHASKRDLLKSLHRLINKIIP